MELGAEEGGDSATDDEGGAVQTKRMDAQPQEEEEEEDEGQSIVHRPGESPNPRNQDAEPPEEAEEQTTEREAETGPRTRAATRRGGVLLGEPLPSKRRRTVSPTFFPRSRLSLTTARFRSAHNKLWRNLSSMTSMRPYEGPR